MSDEGAYGPLFQKGVDETDYERLGDGGLTVESLRGRNYLVVPPETLRELAAEAYARVSYLLRPSHLAQLRAILDDPEASDNDRYVARSLIKNAAIASAGVLPMCQDTGTAIIAGEKGEQVLTEGGDAQALSEGVQRTYATHNLRFSQMAPLSMYEEANTASNLPAQIDIAAVAGEAYRLLFIAKGGGSANKTFLFQQTKSVLGEGRLLDFLAEKIRGLGTAACPPYHLAVVIGGLSAEQTLKTVKMASCRELDGLPEAGDKTGRAFRDRGLEQEILEASRDFGIGAQFGGKYFCHDVRVIRLPRHGASLPIGIGVSCSADRQVRAKITKDGVFLERLEAHPERYLPELSEEADSGVEIDLSAPMEEIRSRLTALPIGRRVLLNGPLIVARDIVHAKLRERLEQGEPLPEYFKAHPIYYAGPARKPEGLPSGSFGPTTSGRMDPYLPEFQPLGGSLVSLGKGNRSRQVVESCRDNGGFYLGAIGGNAAAIARDNITSVEVLDYAELGMEAVWRIEVKDFAAFVVIDDKGNDFFARPG
jgi:fumarate hydratase class I